MPAASIAALMGGDLLALVEELDRAAGGPYVHLLADQPVGHGVEEALVLDVVVGPGPRQPPLGVLVVLRPQRRERVLASGDATSLFEAVEHALDAVSILVGVEVAGHRLLAIRFGRDHWKHTLQEQGYTHFVAIVKLCRGASSRAS